ncbi:hypothetical protein Q1695_003987 [Nippostrongylus brasiliensis]|nr:hypothetical protein Q1695_003987 [Nippostrongylus brasiliensis]
MAVRRRQLQFTPAGGLRSICILLTLAVITAGLQCQTPDGQKFNHGETYLYQEHFIMECEVTSSGWTSHIAACLSWWYHEIPVGEELVYDGMRFICEDRGGGKVSLVQQSLNA